MLLNVKVFIRVYLLPYTGNSIQEKWLQKNLKLLVKPGHGQFRSCHHKTLDHFNGTIY